MTYFLSGDIGGTKTLLQLCARGAQIPVLQKSYASADYPNLEQMVGEFLAETTVHDIAAACFALAGPVSGRVARLTNLPWEVDGDALAARYGIRQVVLINDFEAVGHGIAALQPTDLLPLQKGVEQAGDVRLVVGAGTGLGVAWMSADSGVYQIHPSEGGHMDFAPADEMQFFLLRYLQERHGHVSYERIVSGPGLLAIFEFMQKTGLCMPSAQLSAALEEDDPAAVLTRFYLQEDEPIARMTVALFLSIYGAFVGNLALVSLPRGGIYVAGGIAAKIAAQMQDGEFIHGYLSKGRFGVLLETLPLHVVLNKNVGLIGANLIAQRCTA